MVGAILNVVAYADWCRGVHNFFNVGADSLIVNFRVLAVFVAPNLAC